MEQTPEQARALQISDLLSAGETGWRTIEWHIDGEETSAGWYWELLSQLTLATNDEDLVYGTCRVAFRSMREAEVDVIVLTPSRLVTAEARVTAGHGDPVTRVRPLSVVRELRLGGGSSPWLRPGRGPNWPAHLTVTVVDDEGSTTLPMTDSLESRSALIDQLPSLLKLVSAHRNDDDL